MCEDCKLIHSNSKASKRHIVKRHLPAESLEKKELLKSSTALTRITPTSGSVMTPRTKRNELMTLKPANMITTHVVTVAGATGNVQSSREMFVDLPWAKCLLGLVDKRWIKVSGIDGCEEPHCITVVRVIDGQLWCCCGLGGINKYDTSLNNVGFISCESDMEFITDVAATSNGDVIIAARTGLFRRYKSRGFWRWHNIYIWKRRRRWKTEQFYDRCVQSMVVHSGQLFAACGRSDCRQVVIFAQRYRHWTELKRINLQQLEPRQWVTLSASRDVLQACSTMEDVIAFYDVQSRGGGPEGFIGQARMAAAGITDAESQLYICDSDAYGNLLIADANNHRLHVISEQRQFTVLDMNPMPRHPGSAVYHDDDLYMVVGSNALWKYSSWRDMITRGQRS